MRGSIGARQFPRSSEPRLKRQTQNPKDSKELYQNDISWDSLVPFNTVLSGYLSNQRFPKPRQVFDEISQRDRVPERVLDEARNRPGRSSNVVSSTGLMSGLLRKNMLREARSVFDEMPHRDSISWNVMITGYVRHGSLEDARRVFDEMPDKDSVSWNAMITGYAQSKDMGSARELFEAMPCRNMRSWNTMLRGYAQIGDVERAKSIFDSMGLKDSFSWSAMISAYAQIKLAEEALETFVEMQRCGERLNQLAYTCALSSCAEIGALELGKQLHGHMVKSGFDNFANALLMMYSKCGSIGEAYDIFRKMGNYKNIISWNTIITGFARHGFGREAFAEFDSMMAAGIVPNEVTMLGVLLACNHTGLVDTGTEYFNSMKHKYGITPVLKHYNCMIDLLGRAGRLDEAQDLMKNMPFEPNGGTWGALLGASTIHGNTELGEKAAKKFYELEPENAGIYVMLSNLYASSGRWSDAQKLRLRIRESGVKKVPGYSWVKVQNKVHTFVAGDTDHPEKDKIYACLEGLLGYLYYSS